MGVPLTEVELKAYRGKLLTDWRNGMSIHAIATREKKTVPEMKTLLLKASKEASVQELRPDKKA